MVFRGARSSCYDAIVVGGGHNGLVAAALLARAGRSVVVLERRPELGGAVVSEELFPGTGAKLSRYAYLVSLFPTALARTLGLKLKLRPRTVAWYAPHADTGVMVGHDARLTRESIQRGTGAPGAFEAWQRFHAWLERLAGRVFPTLTEPLRSRGQFRQVVADELAWRALFEEPVSELLERTFESDLLRGVVCTDAMIGTFAPADDPLLRQNRCFLYHVIGNGTGRWEVPVGGMGALSDELAAVAQHAGAEIRTRSEVAAITTDGSVAEVTCVDGQRVQGRQVLANVAPVVLSRLLGEGMPEERPEGSQLKINMLLSRLPRLRDPNISPAQAFAGTFHVNEGYGQLQRAYGEAARGQIPSQPPCELYCHSLTDGTVLPDELRAAGAQSLTLFGLHMPARLFTSAPQERKRAAVDATLRSVDSALAEPLIDCLLRNAHGQPCLEAMTPLEIEHELAMPGGHIFHRDLAWPYAESKVEIGKWGVETAYPNIWLCGAGARRGGGVSGIPGHNAARAVLTAGFDK